jgi:hypothetical protein
MADLIPFIPSENNYSLGVPLGGVRYRFDNIRWNSRDDAGKGAWYFDLREDNGAVILVDIKVVLGVNFGRGSTHRFFKSHVLKAHDTSGKRREAGFDDLGGRVQVLHISLDEALQPTVI